MSATTSSSVTPTARTLVRRVRGPLAAGAVLVLVAAIVTLGSSTGTGLLDTRAATDEGSRAVAELLRDRGVPVEQVRTVAAAAATTDGTLVVAGPDLLPADVAARIAASDARRVVLVAPHDESVVQAFDPSVSVRPGGETGVRDPACALPAAVAAGPVDLGGSTFTSTAPEAVGCYPLGGAGSLLVLERTDRDLVLLGAATPLLNDELAREGNAALALNLLGAHGPVTWYLPSLEDLYGQDVGEDTWIDLVPRGLLWALGWLAVTALLLAAWRARRLGPVVAERLPVVVRAAETVEGRARLYRRARDRGHAAGLLRAAARDRLAAALGSGATGGRAHPDRPTDHAALVDAVARRTGRPPAEVAALLYGAAPPDDARLVALADDLDRLDREVRNP